MVKRNRTKTVLSLSKKGFTVKEKCLLPRWGKLFSSFFNDMFYSPNTVSIHSNWSTRVNKRFSANSLFVIINTSDIKQS